MTVITISREYGSGGDEVARRVCDLLGCRYFDRRLAVQAVTERMPTDEAGQKEPKELGFLDRLLGTDQIVRDAMEAKAAVEGAPGLEAANPEEERNVLGMRAVVEEAYEEGNVVILGRAGQVCLQDRPGVLHVRIEAPLDLRVARTQEQEGLDEHEAEDRVLQQDRAAADFIRTSYGADWDDPLLYHVVINTGKWSLEDAAQLIVDAASHLNS